jgi:predicted lipoprotein
VRRLRLAVVVLVLSSNACGGSAAPADSTETTEDQGVVAARTEVLDDLGQNVVLPGYLSLAQSAAVLRTEVETACATPSGDMSGSRQSWLETMSDWLMIQAYRLGPLQDLDLSASIFFPIDPAKVDANAGAGVSDLSSIGADARGLGAIGHVLYAADKTDEAACAYLEVMAARVAEATETVADAWGEHLEGGWSTTFPTTQAGIEMLVNDVIASVAEAARYLGDPPVDLSLEHDDGRDFDEIEARMTGVRDVYQGAGGQGLSSLVQLAFAPTDERMNERLEDALEVLSATPSDPTQEEYVAAYEAVAAVHRTLTTEVASQLGTTLMFGDSDGDS